MDSETKTKLKLKYVIKKGHISFDWQTSKTTRVDAISIKR